MLEASSASLADVPERGASDGECGECLLVSNSACAWQKLDHGGCMLEIKVTAVGFEPTPLRTGALSQRLRPLGQTVLTCAHYRDP